MRRLLFVVLIGAFWCVTVRGGAPAHAAPLPPCVDGHYGPGDAGVNCQVRGDTTPTARCWDGSFDYLLGLGACALHGGVLIWIVSAAPVVGPPSTQPAYAAPAPAPSFSAVPGSATGRISHTWYTSSQPQAYLYYCDDDPNRQQNDLPQYQVAFSTVTALLAAYPGRVLDQPCKDGSTGP